ncbi:hypothetical protein H8R18_02165 [Nanchangia anserum]|uniref:hypothetical protein n=1 Tax=Nanchangia anserum TaxID=2692125 RepID=UPI001883E4C6|nr:hypothetical protein [Nanchangia anserum]QOX82182.1 hypothetical protein H8R18_02165 [Nanchangia anserum]
MRIISSCAAALLAVTALVGCTPDADTASEKSSSLASGTFPVTLTHASGTTTLKAQPRRIVVLDMAALDTIDAIGAGATRRGHHHRFPARLALGRQGR